MKISDGWEEKKTHSLTITYIDQDDDLGDDWPCVTYFTIHRMDLCNNISRVYRDVFLHRCCWERSELQPACGKGHTPIVQDAMARFLRFGVRSPLLLVPGVSAKILAAFLLSFC